MLRGLELGGGYEGWNGRRLRGLEWEEVKWVELEEVRRVSVGRRLRGLV